MTKPEPTQAVTRYNAQLPTHSMQEVATAGELLAQSGMFGIKNAAAGFVVVATCHQQGISLMEFHRTYHIVEGRPSMRADAMLAEFRKTGGRYGIIENSQTRAAAEFVFEGQKQTFEFTIEDARRTGDCLNGKGELKQIWEKRPEDMLWARMVSRAVRRLCPEINAGMYPPEEVMDFDRDPQQSSAPVPINEAEVARRARVVKPEFDAPTPIVATDSEICPIGGDGYFGCRWDDMLDDDLEAALGYGDPAITDAHRAAVETVLSERKAQK